jgi:hypothetical protein
VLLRPMTASDVRAGTWAPVGPPYSSYEATPGRPGVRGEIRSVDRTVKGRRYKSVTLAQRKPGKYWQVNAVSDDGKVQTVAVHTLIMLAHEGPCPPGKQVRHFDDDPDHNWWAPGGEAACRRGEGNLVYGTPRDQWDDKLRNRPSPSLARAVARHVASLVRRWSA